MPRTHAIADLTVWMYVSRSCLAPDARSAVADIVARAQAHNATVDVTGMLVFTGARFAQLIEGPPAAVAVLKAAVSADQRHEDLIDLMPEPWGGRRFSSWSMGYSGPSRYVRAAVEQTLAASARERRSAATQLARLMIEFAA